LEEAAPQGPEIAAQQAGAANQAAMAENLITGKAAATSST
jgi:hypothetical protein